MNYFEQKELIELNIKNVSMMKKIDKRLYSYILNKEFCYLKYLRNVDESLLESCIHQTPIHIKYIPAPSEKLQFIAVKANLNSCYYIKNMTIPVMEFIIEEDYWPDNLDINKLNKVYQLKVISFKPEEIQNIDPLTDELINLAFEVNHEIVRYIDLPQDLLTKAIKIDGLLLREVSQPTEELILIALNQTGMALEFVSDYTHEMILTAIKNDPKSIQFVKEPTYEYQKLAISTDPKMIRCIEHPHPDIQWDVILRDNYAIIKNQCNKVLLFEEFFDTKVYRSEMFYMLSEALPKLRYLIPKAKCFPGVLQLTVKTEIVLNFRDPDIDFRY